LLECAWDFSIHDFTESTLHKYILPFSSAAQDQFRGHRASSYLTSGGEQSFFNFFEVEPQMGPAPPMKKYRAMFFQTFKILFVCSVATALYAQTGQITTYQLDSNGNYLASYTGFPGTYAIDDTNTFPVSKYPRDGWTQFPVTGWFSVPSDQLVALYNNLVASGSMTRHVGG
jgi:hypothetical protein